MLQAQLFIDADELQDTAPLYEFILEFLIKQDIKGATVFIGRLGYGKNQHLQRPNDLFSFDQIPMMITFIDESERVKKALTELKKEMKSGFIVTNNVDVWK